MTAADDTGTRAQPAFALTGPDHAWPGAPAHAGFATPVSPAAAPPRSAARAPDTTSRARQGREGAPIDGISILLWALSAMTPVVLFTLWALVFSADQSPAADPGDPRARSGDEMRDGDASSRSCPPTRCPVRISEHRIASGSSSRTRDVHSGSRRADLPPARQPLHAP